MPEKEIWRKITGFENYEVSNLGRVRSWVNNRGTKQKTPKISKGSLGKTGYSYASLTKNKNHKNIAIHRLVAQEFISNPENKPQVNHINGIKTDNRVENLEWATNRENARHAWANNLCQRKKGEKNHNAKFTNEQAKQIRAEYIYHSKTHGTVALSKKYSVASATIRRIVKTKAYATITELEE